MRSDIVELKNGHNSRLSTSVIKMTKKHESVLSILESTGFIRGFKRIPTVLGKIQQYEVNFGMFLGRPLIKKFVPFDYKKSRFISYGDLLQMTKNVQGVYILHVAAMSSICTHSEALRFKTGGVLVAYVQ
jgi:ribosomal protein S8